MGCLSTICLVLWSYYACIVSRIYTSSSLKKGAASDLNVLEQLELPEMVFAGSREAQKRVKLGRGKWQKTVKKLLARDQNGRGIIMNTLPWRQKI